ncbi:(2Fe-2S)-binding protein [Actibacterium pelagium]|uniref:2Fe-2S ferredoxin-type domain-containing protein n=1 Tax=Actibacterium pelagium TaxID=2029103 RepID=A0A917AH14_9RHOB|nr:2Fe-2S iron-sulfur cluster-binding protein [Actibacterium pelagium]GGE50422.1 hypothetical protein GCM10011517_17750 [Actibacterium pelagium]
MITFSVNGKLKEVSEARADDKLLDYLHDDLNLTGSKLCCGIGVCRACTVEVFKPPSNAASAIISCKTSLGQINGTQITTIEGATPKDGLLPIQEAFLKNFSFQCGYCAPGFVMASKVFLDWLATQTSITEEALDEAIHDAIGDHICRCTGYVRYFEALKATAQAQLEAQQ